VGEVLHGSLLQLLLEHCDFLNIDISQCSVATRLMCGGIFKYELVANLPVSLPVKEFRKSVNIWGSYGQEFSVFFETQCIMFRLKSHYVTTEKDVVSLSYVNKMYFELENQNLIQVSVQIRASADNAHSADARCCCGAAAAVERRPCSNRSPSPARQVNSSKPAAAARAAG